MTKTESEKARASHSRSEEVWSAVANIACIPYSVSNEKTEKDRYVPWNIVEIVIAIKICWQRQRSTLGCLLAWLVQRSLAGGSFSCSFACPFAAGSGGRAWTAITRRGAQVQLTTKANCVTHFCFNHA